jgi:hypothetical protein
MVLNSELSGASFVKAASIHDYELATSSFYPTMLLGS